MASTTKLVELFNADAAVAAAATTTAFVEAAYENLLGLSGEFSNKDERVGYWVGQINTGEVSKADFAAAFLAAAAVKGDILTNAEFAANTETLEAIAAADEASLTTLADVKVVATGSTSVSTGQTYTLTTAADNAVGTSADDVFNAYIDSTASAPQTLTAADTLSGGEGSDVLNVAVSGTAIALPAANITGIETINVRAAVALSSSDLSTVPGVTEFNSDRSVAAITTTNMVKGGEYGVIGDGSAQSTATYAFGYAASADTATLNVSGGVKGTTATNGPAVTITGSGVTSTVINATGTAANVLGTVTNAATSTSTTINATSNLTATLSVTGDTKLTATGSAVIDLDASALGNGIVTVDASAMTAGGLKVAAGTSTAFKFTGGAGDDYVTTGATLATGLVDAGEGSADRLIVGTGTHIDATAGKLYKNFEHLQVDGVTVDVDNLASTNTIDAVTLNGNSSIVTNLSSTAAANVTVASGATGATIGVKGATTSGQIDTVNASLTTTTAAGAGQAIDLTALTLTGVEKLVLTGNGTADATTGAVTFTTTNATSLDSITLSNADNANVITVAAGHTATNLVIDTSASTGGTAIDASLNATATGVTAKGGSSYDVIQGAAGLSDIITGGAGNDVISGGADGTSTFTAGTASAIGSATAGFTALTAADTLTGGEGRDMFVLGTNSTLANMSIITDLDLGGSSSATGVDGITLDLATAGSTTAPSIVVLTDTQKANIAAASTLAAAFDVACAVDTTVNAVVQFTYGGDEYLFVNGVAAGSTYSATNDVAIKISGVTGTLDASDITIV